MRNSLLKDRAWIEINSKNLIYNINQIKNIISNKTKIIAVVKANAYGHGMIEISKILNNNGIEDFAVATLSEAIELRENGIKGNILILGYTDFINLKYVIKYDLIQTITDYEYSKKIARLNLKNKINCHIKINTGMNRLGEKYNDISKIIKIFKNKNLNILGMYSHLSVADSRKQEDIEFTKKQIENFKKCILNLEKKGYNPGTIHIQSSYGIINYNEYEFDYVRAGIIMYGVHNAVPLKNNIDLKPVLKLKARITSIRNIKDKESVGYGRMYKAKKNIKLASVSIGYADGYPRNLSLKNTKVKVKNKYVKIVGRICMDQLMIDVTDIDDLKVGDIVTLIDDNLISIENISKKSDTITHELLSRLGTRLNRIVYY